MVLPVLVFSPIRALAFPSVLLNKPPLEPASRLPRCDVYCGHVLLPLA
jgi:hypothetical protein